MRESSVFLMYRFCLVISRGQTNSELSLLHQIPLPILLSICISSAKPGGIRVFYDFSRRRLFNERDTSTTIQTLLSFKMFRIESTRNLFIKIPKALFLLYGSEIIDNQICSALQSCFFYYVVSWGLSSATNTCGTEVLLTSHSVFSVTGNLAGSGKLNLSFSTLKYTAEFSNILTSLIQPWTQTWINNHSQQMPRILHYKISYNHKNQTYNNSQNI